MSTITCTSPANTRIANRQARNRCREKNPVRKQEVKEWCKGKVCSCGSVQCGKPANTAHHPNNTLYGDEWGDLRECEPYYSHCHHLRHKGYDRCPECGGWMWKGRERCSKCDRAGQERRNLRRLSHSCGLNRGKQKCRRQGPDGKVHVYLCPHSSKKAEKECEHFVRRVK